MGVAVGEEEMDESSVEVELEMVEEEEEAAEEGRECD